MVAYDEATRRRVRIGAGPLPELDPLNDLRAKNVRRLSVSQPRIDANIFNKFPKLEFLTISGKLESAAALSRLDRLRSLTMYRTDICDLEFLPQNLRSFVFRIENEEALDCSALRQLSSLRELSMIYFRSCIALDDPIRIDPEFTQMDLTLHQFPADTVLNDLRVFRFFNEMAKTFGQKWQPAKARQVAMDFEISINQDLLDWLQRQPNFRLIEFDHAFYQSEQFKQLKENMPDVLFEGYDDGIN